MPPQGVAAPNGRSNSRKQTEEVDSEEKSANSESNQERDCSEVHARLKE